MSVGVIHKRSTVLPVAYIGTRPVDGGVFQVGSNPSTKLPIIHSRETGRVWTVSWDALVRLAIADGILTDPDGRADDGSEGGDE